MPHEITAPCSFLGSGAAEPSPVMPPWASSHHVWRSTRVTLGAEASPPHAHVLPLGHHSFIDDRFLVTAELFSEDGSHPQPSQPISLPRGQARELGAARELHTDMGETPHRRGHGGSEVQLVLHPQLASPLEQPAARARSI